MDLWAKISAISSLPPAFPVSVRDMIKKLETYTTGMITTMMATWIGKAFWISMRTQQKKTDHLQFGLI